MCDVTGRNNGQINARCTVKLGIITNFIHNEFMYVDFKTSYFQNNFVDRASSRKSNSISELADRLQIQSSFTNVSGHRKLALDERMAEVMEGSLKHYTDEAGEITTFYYLTIFS